MKMSRRVRAWMYAPSRVFLIAAVALASMPAARAVVGAKYPDKRFKHKAGDGPYDCLSAGGRNYRFAGLRYKLYRDATGVTTPYYRADAQGVLRYVSGHMTYFDLRFVYRGGDKYSGARPGESFANFTYNFDVFDGNPALNPPQPLVPAQGWLDCGGFVDWNNYTLVGHDQDERVPFPWIYGSGPKKGDPVPLAEPEDECLFSVDQRFSVEVKDRWQRLAGPAGAHHLTYLFGKTTRWYSGKTVDPVEAAPILAKK